MKKIILILFATFLSSISFAQIDNFEDERNYMSALSELVAQSYSEQFNETTGTMHEDPDEANRQLFLFDSMTMNLVYYKTPYNSSDDGKNPGEIAWAAKYVIPLYEIEKLIRGKKNTITIKMKDGKSTIQSYMIMSGKEYYPATKENKLDIYSDKLLKIRNLYNRLNWRISELQNFHKKKMALVDYLNKKLHKEAEYQTTDSLNYPEDRKFKILEEFQLDSSRQWLSVKVEKQNIYGNPLIEKQSVRLKDIAEVVKDITIILSSKVDDVLKTTTVINEKDESRIIKTADNLFFLHFYYEKSNEETGDKILKLFGQMGMKITKGFWFD